MIPTWDQMHAAILQQMDESEKATGIRKTTKGALAKTFGWSGGQNVSYYISKKYASEFVAAEFVCVNGGPRGGIYMKNDVENKLLIPARCIVSNPKSQTDKSDNVLSLIDRLDAPVEKKTIETLLAEQIRLQLDRNAQFADRIFQIAMGA